MEMNNRLIRLEAIELSEEIGALLSTIHEVIDNRDAGGTFKDASKVLTIARRKLTKLDKDISAFQFDETV